MEASIPSRDHRVGWPIVGWKSGQRALGPATSGEMSKTPRSPPNTPYVIEIVAFPSVQLLDVSGPLQVFSTANDIVTESGGSPPYAPRVVAQGGRGVIASAGLGLAAERLPPIEATLDTLIVAGGDGVQAAAADPVLVDWIR